MKFTRGLVTASVCLSLCGVAWAQPADPAKQPPASTPAKETPAQPAKPAEPAKDKPAAAQPAVETKPAKEQFVYVSMKTSKGEIVLELDKEKAPISVENFTKYVDKGFYDGTIFHRVIANFMIQGGGFTPDLKQKSTDAPIKNEWKNGLKNKRGTIAMARTAVADSATSQFFINIVDNDFLDQPRDGAAYTVFGRVVSGMETVDAIRAVKTGVKNGMGDVPVETVTIDKVVRLADFDPSKAKK